MACLHCKEHGHLLARGDILVNLDCDNFTGERGASHVINHFIRNADDIVLHQARDLFNGSFGRISVRRTDFLAIGGYDESLLPMGYEDVDLIERLKALGLVYVHDTNERFNKSIPNTRDEGIVNIKEKVSYAEMVRKNRIKSQENIAEGRLVANKNHQMGVII